MFKCFKAEKSKAEHSSAAEKIWSKMAVYKDYQDYYYVAPDGRPDLGVYPVSSWTSTNQTYPTLYEVGRHPLRCWNIVDIRKRPYFRIRNMQATIALAKKLEKVYEDYEQRKRVAEEHERRKDSYVPIKVWR